LTGICLGNVCSCHEILRRNGPGQLVGLVSVVFVKSIYWSEDFFEAMPGNYYSRHSIGMLMQGVMIYLFMHFTGHYYVQGVGYATITDVLTWSAFDGSSDAGSAAGSNSNSSLPEVDNNENGISNPPFCLLLFFAKLFSTNITIGSGASGASAVASQNPSRTRLI
jgi:CIC family chloride channel protein